MMRGDLPGRRVERDVVDGDQAAEAHGQMLDASRGAAIAMPDAAVICFMASGGGLARRMQADRRLAVGQQAARPPDHDQHHADAEGEHAVVRELAEQLGQADQHGRRQHDADLAAEAAEHDDRQDHRGFQEDEALRADEAVARGEEGAGEAARTWRRRRRPSAWCWSG